MGCRRHSEILDRGRENRPLRCPVNRAFYLHYPGRSRARPMMTASEGPSLRDRLYPHARARVPLARSRALQSVGPVRSAAGCGCSIACRLRQLCTRGLHQDAVSFFLLELAMLSTRSRARHAPVDWFCSGWSFLKLTAFDYLCLSPGAARRFYRFKNIHNSVSRAGCDPYTDRWRGVPLPRDALRAGGRYRRRSERSRFVARRKNRTGGRRGPPPLGARHALYYCVNLLPKKEFLTAISSRSWLRHRSLWPKRTSVTVDAGIPGVDTRIYELSSFL